MPSADIDHTTTLLSNAPLASRLPPLVHVNTYRYRGVPTISPGDGCRRKALPLVLGVVHDRYDTVPNPKVRFRELHVLSRQDS